MPFSIIGSIARSLAKAVSQAKKNSGSSSSSTKSSGSSSGSKSTTSGGSVWSSGGLSSHTYTVDAKGNIYKNGRWVDTNDPKVRQALSSDPGGRAALDQSRLVKTGGSTPTYQSGGSTATTTTPKTTSTPSGSGAVWSSGGLSSHTYTIDAKGNIYKNGVWVNVNDPKARQALSSDPGGRAALEQARLVKSGGASGGGTTPQAQLNTAVQYTEQTPQWDWSGLLQNLGGFLTGNIPQMQAVPTQQTLMTEIRPIIDELINIAYEASQSPESAVMLNRAYEQTLQTIDQIQNQIVSTMQQQMAGVDPATVSALTALRESVQRQREELMEEMSRRGLLQSGIWLEMEDRLNRGLLTEEQRLLAERIANLQNQLNQALTTFGQMRVEAAQQFGVEGLQQLEQQAQRRASAIMEGLNRAVDLYKYAKDYVLDEWETYAPYWYLTAEQREQLPIDWAETIGEVPDYTGREGYTHRDEVVPVREYVGNMGTVQFDNKTKEVIINGVRVKPERIEDGKAYVKRAVLDRILYGY